MSIYQVLELIVLKNRNTSKKNWGTIKINPPSFRDGRDVHAFVREDFE